VKEKESVWRSQKGEKSNITSIQEREKGRFSRAKTGEAVDRPKKRENKKRRNA